MPSRRDAARACLSGQSGAVVPRSTTNPTSPTPPQWPVAVHRDGRRHPRGHVWRSPRQPRRAASEGQGGPGCLLLGPPATRAALGPLRCPPAGHPPPADRAPGNARCLCSRWGRRRCGCYDLRDGSPGRLGGAGRASVGPSRKPNAPWVGRPIMGTAHRAEGTGHAGGSCDRRHRACSRRTRRRARGRIRAARAAAGHRTGRGADAPAVRPAVARDRGAVVTGGRCPSGRRPRQGPGGRVACGGRPCRSLPRDAEQRVGRRQGDAEQGVAEHLAGQRHRPGPEPESQRAGP